MILICLAETAFGAGVSQGIKKEIAITFIVMALPVVSFRLYFTLWRAGIMKRPLLTRFFQPALFLLSEGLFYLAFVYLSVISTHWGISIAAIVVLVGFVDILFSLAQHYLFGPKDDGVPPRLIYAASHFAYLAMISPLI